MLQPNVPTISSACHWDQPQCLEVTLVDRRGKVPRWRRAIDAYVGIAIELRDSKLGSASPVEQFGLREWWWFLRHIHEWRPAVDGRFRIGDLAFTRGEVDAFIDGADAGEFEPSVQ